MPTAQKDNGYGCRLGDEGRLGDEWFELRDEELAKITINNQNLLEVVREVYRDIYEINPDEINPETDSDIMAKEIDQDDVERLAEFLNEMEDRLGIEVDSESPKTIREVCELILFCYNRK